MGKLPSGLRLAVWTGGWSRVPPCKGGVGSNPTMGTQALWPNSTQVLLWVLAGRGFAAGFAWISGRRDEYAAWLHRPSLNAWWRAPMVRVPTVHLHGCACYFPSVHSARPMCTVHVVYLHIFFSVFSFLFLFFAQKY